MNYRYHHWHNTVSLNIDDRGEYDLPVRYREFSHATSEV